MVRVGVPDAAARLGVSERRVRQLLADGQLAGEQVGRTWVIDTEELLAVERRAAEAGRPWSPASAWAVLKVADGNDAGLQPTQRHRARQRLDRGLRAIVGRLGTRSERRWFFAHPGVLDRLAAQTAVVRGGVSAAAEHGSDLVVMNFLEGYVRAADLDGLVNRFALDPDSSQPNVLLRVVGDDVWPFLAGQVVAGRSTVAVDLLDADEPRTRRAGEDLLRG